MAARESLREVENLRFRFQMKNRLRLECLAAISKVFREFDEPVSDELLSTFVFALPQELVNGHNGRFARFEESTALAFEHEKPGLPPNKPDKNDKPDKPEKPDKPDNDQPPEPAPLPPESPAPLPPESPAGLPPQQPAEFASEYLA